MRMLMAALLAGATFATAAVAQEGTIQDRAQQRQVAREGMRQALGGNREARQERRADRQEFRQDRRGDRQEFRGERRQDFRDFRQERREDRQEFRQERREDRQDLREGDVTRREFRRDRAEDRRDFRRDRAQDTREFRRDRLQDGRDFRRERWDDRRDWQRDRNGNWGWNGNRWGFDDRNGGGWNREWRRDRRYDWQGWRQQNRNFYRAPRYFAPPGWGFGYRRFSLGVILSAPLFGQNYWLDDPWQYRLPPAHGPYRWVRYWDDVMLVDVRDGRVVDVIYDFFW